MVKRIVRRNGKAKNTHRPVVRSTNRVITRQVGRLKKQVSALQKKVSRGLKRRRK